MHRKELAAALMVISIVAAVLVYIAAHAIGQVLAFQNARPTSVIDTSSWQTYQNTTYGFSLQYPPNWQISTDGLSDNDPFVAIGDPLNGTSTYALNIYIENNSSTLSAGDYVHAFLAADRAEDKANAASGPAPQITPQFSKSFLVMIAGQEAYELDTVFEFDHNAEQIYVAAGGNILRFDFPVAQENPNISLPVKNNAIAHQIVNTLMLN